MKTIGVLTGTRAEYGLLKPLMQAISEDRSLQLKTIVTGMHLCPDFGLTRDLILEDGFAIDETVEMLLGSDTPVAVCKSMGLGMMGYAEALERLKPDGMVLLGDRFEMFCAAAACLVCGIPIAHIHGGELTYGAWDDAFRHGITKMARLHFTCAEAYRKRVIQMGENPDTVYNVGALGVENILTTKLIDQKSLSTITGFPVDAPYLLVTFHPETIKKEQSLIDFDCLLSSLSLKDCDKYRIILTKANADLFGRVMNQKAQNFVAEHPGRAVLFDSMGHTNYLSAMKYAAAVVGNSSSGIIEAPSFKVPVVNIGSRQDGRIRARNIIDCRPDTASVLDALEKALSLNFKSSLENMENPFEKKETAGRICQIIKETSLCGKTVKRFFDLDIESRRIL